MSRADYRGQVFQGTVDFRDCVFSGGADFTGTVFKGRVSFRGATFQQGAEFRDAVFESFADFDEVLVVGDAGFSGARFPSGLSARNLRIQGDLRLDRAGFDLSGRLGPLQADSVDLRLAVFACRVRLEFDAGRVRCERTMFQGGVQFLLGSADVVLEDSELGPASLLAMHTGLPYEKDDHRPRLLTVSGTDVSNLTVSRVDLSVCKWIYAHGLDKLTITVDDALGWSPPGPWVTRRQVIADEVRWRELYDRGPARRRWRAPRDWPPLGAPPTAGHVANAYRALRKASEDAKDAPGAADFYYGEMEMRRHGKRLEARLLARRRLWRGWLVARAEYALLWSYWLVSGYGLRASRGLAALAAAVALAAVAFHTWGFPAAGPPMTLGDCVRVSMRSATSIARGSEMRLSAAGEWIELLLRVTGPLLLGMTLLAVRGRVKR